ncbi:hypothetical protein [Brevibacterium senegalense]|uniref:hypothetical protein n=1 Tax=Brevibacterium senegalense TaxID=1033736 RepID=UPI0002DC206E|nr:hypothetical protein [Brevibacterium senegalense]
MDGCEGGDDEQRHQDEFGEDSCRTQANDLTDVQGVTLAQLLTGMELGPEHSARAQRLPDAGIAQSARVGDAGNGAQAGAETAARATQPVSVSIG